MPLLRGTREIAAAAQRQKILQPSEFHLLAAPVHGREISCGKAVGRAKTTNDGQDYQQRVEDGQGGSMAANRDPGGIELLVFGISQADPGH
ncbi:MAG TPA: hypothetical protein VHA35_19405 [Dongiaceae bacterium]|nr:hypothetical protein [Dongiaceae bacterium]